MLGAFPIARIKGIRVEIHPSWLLILALLSWMLADSVFPEAYDGWSTQAYWAVGVAAALLLFVTVLIHELAHALVAKSLGMPVPKITLFIFGGVSHLGRQPKTAGEEFAIAIAGPLTSFGIAILAGSGAGAASFWNEKVTAILGYLSIVNVALGAFNLLPGFPLDGGRVLRSAAWKHTGSFARATRIAGGTGEFVAFGMIAIGALFLVYGYVLDGLWLMLIAWFLTGAAKAETQGAMVEGTLARLLVRDLMRTDYVSVPPGISIQDVVDEQMLAHGERAVLVALDDAVQGIVTVADVRHVDRDAWGSTPIQSVMTSRDHVATVSADATALEALHILSTKRVHQAPVLDAGRMVGLITTRQLMDRLQLAETLGDRVVDLPVEPQKGDVGS
jgi:Zn-dependent protease/predicted transcriptional regulator